MSVTFIERYRQFSDEAIFKIINIFYPTKKNVKLFMAGKEMSTIFNVDTLKNLSIFKKKIPRYFIIVCEDWWALATIITTLYFLCNS
jgi:hypothetical protein